MPLPPSPVPTALSQSRQTWHIKLSIYAWIPTLDSRFGKVASVQIHRSVSVYDNWCFADGTFRNFHTWFFALKDTYDSWPSTEGLCCSLQARWNNFKVSWDQEFYCAKLIFSRKKTNSRFSHLSQFHEILGNIIFDF